MDKLNLDFNWRIIVSKPKKTEQPSNSIRNLVDSSPHRTTGGAFVEALMDSVSEFESYNERFALETLILCHDVSKITSQPIRMSYKDPIGNSRHHVPDYCVETPSGQLFMEVKSLANLVSKNSLEKYLHVANGYRQARKRLAFLVDVQLLIEPRFSSVKILSRYVNCIPSGQTKNKVIQILTTAPLQITTLIAQYKCTLLDIYVLIARRVVCFDWNQPLNETTWVSLPNQPFRGLKIENILRESRYGGLLEEMALGRYPTNQQLMADAAAGRQLRHTPHAFSMVGGFAAAQPLRDLRKDESPNGKIWDRRDRAPGFHIIKHNHR